jgi:hypothetical protein
MKRMEDTTDQEVQAELNRRLLKSKRSVAYARWIAFALFAAFFILWFAVLRF